MSLKEDLSAVKEELNTEEQFLEGLIRAERFYKKYKKQLIGLVSVAIVAFIAYSVKVYIDQSNLKASNEAYLKLLSNPGDSEAKSILKSKNKNLYYAYEFQTANKKNDKSLFKEIINSSKDENLKDLASYQIASIDGKQDEISSYINNSKVALLKNMALLDEAYLLLKQGKKSEAKMKLSLIEVNSPLRSVASNLEHFIK